MQKYQLQRIDDQDENEKGKHPFLICFVFISMVFVHKITQNCVRHNKSKHYEVLNAYLYNSIYFKI